MKATFDKLSNCYLGDYMQEYKNAGFLKGQSGKEALEQREKIKKGDLLEIAITYSRFAGFVIERAQEADNSETTKDFRKIANGAIFRMQHLISFEKYQAIESALEHFSPELRSYTDDFALMVIYAENEVFGKGQKRKERLVVSDELRRGVRNFFAAVANKDNEVDVNKITVSYSCNGKNKKLHMDSPMLMKMMLYEFSRKYYTWIEGADENNWEDTIGLYLEKPKKGNQGHDYKHDLKAIIHVGWLFMDSENIFGGLTDKKYALLGRLFALVGLPPYNPSRKTEYEDEDDYYTRILKKYWKK